MYNRAMHEYQAAKQLHDGLIAYACNTLLMTEEQISCISDLLIMLPTWSNFYITFIILPSLYLQSWLWKISSLTHHIFAVKVVLQRNLYCSLDCPWLRQKSHLWMQLPVAEMSCGFNALCPCHSNTCNLAIVTLGGMVGNSSRQCRSLVASKLIFDYSKTCDLEPVSSMRCILLVLRATPTLSRDVHCIVPAHCFQHWTAKLSKIALQGYAWWPSDNLSEFCILWTAFNTAAYSGMGPEPWHFIVSFSINFSLPDSSPSISTWLHSSQKMVQLSCLFASGMADLQLYLQTKPSLWKSWRSFKLGLQDGAFKQRLIICNS